MPELLLELLSEEIPARMQARAAEDLKRLVCKCLNDAALEFDRADAFATPRRLALVIDGLPERTAPGREVRRGPRVGAPQKAIDGFLKSVARPSVEHEDIKVRETEKGRFYFFEAPTAPKATARELPSLLEAAIDAVPWPKSMRWKGGQTQPWVRPLHGILAIFDGEMLDLEYNLVQTAEAAVNSTIDNTLFSGNETFGHRFLAPESFAVTSFADYEAKLRKAFVILNPAERRRIIVEKARALAKAEGLVFREDPALLEENAGLVEWPVVLLGRIDERFMDVPDEVLVTSMRTHQRYFPLFTAWGSLAPRFIIVSNMEAEDGGAAITAGNERVLRARLYDAKFFWDQDRKRTLASRAPALAGIVFHAKLGTLDQKADRVQALATTLAGRIPGADKDRVRSAARLCKADLTTEMVVEFPELQGAMGRHYALNDGEAPEVAEAIAEHYAPQGPDDRCPTAPVSVAVALADKIDTLVGFFAIGERPTGSKDPFALRRAALGVIRLIVENRLRLRLREAFVSAFECYEKLLEGSADAVADQLLDFIADRLKVHVREQGVRHDLVAAVFALVGEDDLVRLLARVGALADFLGSDDGEHLLTAYRRAANIVRIEEKRDGVRYDPPPLEDRLRQDEEIALHRSLTQIFRESSKLLKNERITAAMLELARLRGPVDKFFDEVTVNCDEPALRANRLRLLSQIRDTMNAVADFSKIEG